MSSTSSGTNVLLEQLPAMNDLLLKSLNIRTDGSCSQHPSVTLWDKNGSGFRGVLGQCDLCAMEVKKKGIDGMKQLGDTYTTFSSSFLFGTGESAASLSSNAHVFSSIGEGTERYN